MKVVWRAPLILLLASTWSHPAAAQTQGPLTVGSAQMRGTTPFLGGVPSGPPSSDVLTITIVDAMSRALEHNLGVLTAEAQLSPDAPRPAPYGVGRVRARVASRRTASTTAAVEGRRRSLALVET